MGEGVKKSGNFVNVIYGSPLVGTNCYFDPTTTLETLAMMKEGLANAGLLDKPTYLMAQPLGFHTQDATTKFGYDTETGLEAIERLLFLASFPLPSTGKKEGGEKTQPFNRIPSHPVITAFFIHSVAIFCYSCLVKVARACSGSR